MGQCLIPHCSDLNSRTHAFAAHLPLIFQEISGRDVTRRTGALTMVAQWLLGSRSNLDDLVTYFHLLDVLPAIDCSPNQHQQRAMTEVCLELDRDAPMDSHISAASTHPGILVIWGVLLQLLSRVQPPSNIASLRTLYRLTKDEATLPKPAVAFDSHCHLDRCWRDFRLPADASLQQICSKARPDDEHVVDLEGVVANYCDPETYPSIEEIRTDQSGLIYDSGASPNEIHYRGAASTP